MGKREREREREREKPTFFVWIRRCVRHLSEGVNAKTTPF
jgi:hypothetical protein